MQAPGRRIEQVDAHGNVTHLLTVEDPHKEIEIVVTGDVEVAGEGELLPHEGPLSPLAYLFATPLTVANDALDALSKEYLGGTEPLRDRLYALAGGVGERVRYQKGATSVEDSAAAVLARGEGVCQDQAQVFISCCRAAGIPARYVSGYLYSGNGNTRRHSRQPCVGRCVDSRVQVLARHRRHPPGADRRASLPPRRGPGLPRRRSRSRCSPGRWP